MFLLLLLSLSKYQDKRIEKINQTKMKNNNLFQIPINIQVIQYSFRVNEIFCLVFFYLTLFLSKRKINFDSYKEEDKLTDMIQIDSLIKKYGEFVALQIPNLVLQENESIGLVGNNGAGKTTLLSLIVDLIEASEGSVFSDNKNVTETEEWKFYTGSFLNESFLIPFLTPLEYFEFVGKLHRLNKEDIHEFLAENKDFFSYEDNRKTLIRDLSAGNKNKVGILGALLPKPKLLILDEPFSYLDPTSQSWLKLKLKALHQTGTTLLVSSHDLLHITEISSRIILLEKGEVIKDSAKNTDTLAELEAYFRVETI
jgi:ABC-2 type transport system ATP-binding protein